MNESNPTAVNVFVYGTLIPGEPNYRIAAPYVRKTRPGALRGHLYDVGAFPALVLDPGGASSEACGSPSILPG
ncbi:gamma-glutamylcyclotransferase family protein [Pyrinomonas sp.]|uniref:gamma-glutamylcyclotransferase family protein n=1 Tax=Pyrinomonas sp. TaxID=2080306 RepID=UPI003319E6DA